MQYLMNRYINYFDITQQNYNSSIILKYASIIWSPFSKVNTFSSLIE